MDTGISSLMALLLQCTHEVVTTRTTPRLPWLERTRGLARLVVLGLPIWLGAVETRQPSPPEGVQRFGGIVYRMAGWQPLRLDLYVPEGPAPAGGRPLLLAIHGGGWRGGSRIDYGTMMARFAQAGYVVASVDYRLSRPGAPSWPGNLEDVQAAVHWLRRHASDYGIDPDRIAAIGSSAGGHLAALLGTWPATQTEPDSPETPLVRAVINFYGPSDLPGLLDRPIAGAAVRRMLGAAPAELASLAVTASPVHRVRPGSTPMLLIYGDEDQTVPPEQGQRLAQALERAGVRYQWHRIAGARHGFGLSDTGHDFVPEILAFLQATWDHE